MKTLVIILFILLLISSFEIYKQDHQVREFKEQQRDSRTTILILKRQVASLSYNYGESVAKEHCMMCHGFALKTDNMLEGVVDRLGQQYLSMFLTRQDSLLAAKDPYIIQLKAQYNNQPNNHNFNFPPADIKAVIEFMR